MTFPQAPALPEEFDRLTRRMRLPCMRKAAPDVPATAHAQRRDPAEVLRLPITEEVTGRDAANTAERKTAIPNRSADHTAPRSRRVPEADGGTPR